MTNNEIKNINLLGHKRNINNLISNNDFNTNEEEKKEENKPTKLKLKKPILVYDDISEKNGENNLKEKNGIKYDNISKTNENIIYKKLCQRCNSGDNVLYFNNLKSILDYLSKNKIFISKNFYFGENVNFISPKLICLNCLSEISKNATEFEKFIELNKYEKNNDNDDPFYNLFQQSNLKYFNSTKKIKNKSKKQKGLNDKFRNASKKFYSPYMKMPSYQNNLPNNNNNDAYYNPNINYDYLNYIYNQNLSSSNYNNYYTQINPNFNDLNIQNYYNNDLNSLYSINNYFEKPETKNNNINQNSPTHHSNTNNSLQNSSLNNEIRQYSPNNTDKVLSQSPVSKKTISTEKNNENEKSQNTIMINKENISNENKEILEQNEASNNYVLVQIEDFEEIFQTTSHLYHKLLDIKICRDLNLDTSKIFNKDNQNVSSNNFSFLNNGLKDISNINLVLNHISNTNNFNDNNYKYNFNSSNNDLYSNQNTVENHINANDKSN